MAESKGDGAWAARKATHEPDPFADEARRTAEPACAGVGSATATLAGRTLPASSSRIQRANGRVYFPIADCSSALFERSSKSWR